MKALQCTELGGPEKLIVKEVPDQVIAEEHIIIEVKSASVNFLARRWPKISSRRAL